jgi:hypothetical protein
MRTHAPAATVATLVVRRLAHRYARRYSQRALAPGRAPRASLAALGVALTALIATAALGPSAAVQPLPAHPPFGWNADPPAWLVTGLLVLVVVSGAYGVGGCLAALRRGWALRVRWLLAAAALAAAALGVLAPVGSADPGSYAAYGHLAATGQDPYRTPPSALAGPYRGLAEPPWQDTTSVYGPIATGEQWVAAKLAGTGPHAPAYAVFALGLFNAALFVVTGLALQLLAAGQAGRRRAAVLFSANPLLLFEGVAGAHVDVAVAFLVVAGVLALRRTGLGGTLAAGILGGAAAAVKASAALAGLGFAWAVGTSRRAGAQLAVLAIGAAAVLIPAYAIAGSHAFDQLGRASGFVSFANPWRIVTHLMEVTLGHDAARAVIRVLAWLAFALFVVVLDRGLPGRRRAHGQLADRAASAARSAAVLTLAWLLTAPYVLPWYAITTFALFTLLPASGFDRILIVWISVLAIAYLPGRQVSLPSGLSGALDVWKSGFSPVLLALTALAALTLSLRTRA